MSEIEWINQIKVTFRSKFWIVILCTILAAAGMMAERYVNGNYVIKSRKIHVEETVQVIPRQESIIESVDLSGRNFDRLFLSYTFLDQFINSNDNIDFTKYNADWDHLSTEKKLSWMQTHVYVNRFGGDLYQFVFTLSENDSKDGNYASSHSMEFLKYFITYAESQVKSIYPDYAFKEVGSFELMPVVTHISKERIILKYGIAGGVMGFLVGCVIILGIAVKASRRG